MKKSYWIKTNLVLLVTGEAATVDHIVEGDVRDLLEAAGRHVQADRAVEQQGAQLEEGVEGEGGHVGLAPPVPPLLHILLKLHPPVAGQIEARL